MPTGRIGGGIPDRSSVTGISGNLGRTLAKLLHSEERIIGIDRRPFRGKPKDVEMHQLDLRKKKARGRLPPERGPRASSTWGSCTTRA